MAMVLRFRMLSDENDNFLRDYEVMSDMSLFGFHDFICTDLTYDKDAPSSFFISDGEWDRLDEYTLFDMGTDNGPGDMKAFTLGQLMKNNGDRLIFLFDMFGNRAFYLELTGSAQARPDTEYPRTAEVQANAPDQFDPSLGEGVAGSIFDEALGDFGNFEGDDLYYDEF